MYSDLFTCVKPNGIIVTIYMVDAAYFLFVELELISR